MKVVIIGARSRSCVKYREDFNKSNRTPEYLFTELRRIHKTDSELIDGIVEKLQSKYRSTLILLSTGCDDGVGAITKSTSINNKVRFVEISCHFFNNHGVSNNSRAEYMQFYAARNAFFDEIGDEYYFLVNDTRNSIVENLYERIMIAGPNRPNVRPYTIYAEDGRVIETNRQPEEK